MPFLDAQPPIAFAHRGFSPDGCENSMVAFERAVALGYHYLETDVRVTADGVAVVFHDAHLDRVTDQKGRIADLPWRVVQHARIRGREPIPTLVELLGAWPHARINIDIKSAAGVGPTVDAIRSSGSIDRVCVAAFSDARVKAAQAALGAQLCTALGPREMFARWRRSRRSPLAASLDAAMPHTRCLQAPVRIGRLPFVDERLVRAARADGIAVHVWTVNDAAEMTRLLDMGVDGIVTDAADVLRAVLVERGQWSTTLSD